MRIDDSTYSRVVAWLKILLPILALALLSTLFLVARTVDPAQQLPFADVDVDEIARNERIGKPNYSGLTSEGAAIELKAASASPDQDDPNRMQGQEVRAAIDLPSGETIDISAGEMLLDTTVGQATLQQTVRIQSESGYSMETDAVVVHLDRTRVYSSDPTRLSGAIGRLSANSFELTAQDNSQENYVLVFKGDVKLIYDPDI